MWRKFKKAWRKYQELIWYRNTGINPDEWREFKKWQKEQEKE